ncbi:MAG: hypothetical protein WCA79_17770 [Anaerolineales bacterium]
MAFDVIGVGEAAETAALGSCVNEQASMAKQATAKATSGILFF